LAPQSIEGLRVFSSGLAKEVVVHCDKFKDRRFCLWPIIFLPGVRNPDNGFVLGKVDVNVVSLGLMLECCKAIGVSLELRCERNSGLGVHGLDITAWFLLSLLETKLHFTNYIDLVHHQLALT
jgi:hypothetical protein